MGSHVFLALSSIYCGINIYIYSRQRTNDVSRRLPFQALLPAGAAYTARSSTRHVSLTADCVETCSTSAVVVVVKPARSGHSKSVYSRPGTEGTPFRVGVVLFYILGQ